MDKKNKPSSKSREIDGAKLYIINDNYTINKLLNAGKIINGFEVNDPDNSFMPENFNPVKEIAGCLYDLKDDYINLEKTIRKFSFCYSKSVILSVFKELKESDLFDNEYLEVIKKDTLRVPTDNEITSILINENDLIYQPSTGFYLYKDDLWKLFESDNTVKSLIDRQLCRYSTGGKIESILKTLKARCDSAFKGVKFDQKDIYQFSNGTLELDTLEFRDPDRNDFNTFRVDYPYNPDAECPKWNQFIDEITSHNKDKALLLQEIAGYTLFPKNIFQKIAYLIGKGSNGKSIFIDVLTEVLGNENVTHLKVSQLNEEFYRIRLTGSKLNIFNEVDSKDKAPTEELKKFADGDKMTGSLKHKQNVEFKSRAKGIILANNYPNSVDYSYGFYRRLLFVGFNEKFKEDPREENENEHLLDPDLEEQLMKELSGIFNWMLEGYKRLQKNRHFTVTEESKEIQKEFLILNDSVVDFVLHGFDKDKAITNAKNEYDNYKAFCQKYGRSSVSLATFERRFYASVTDQFRNWSKQRRKTGYVAVNLSKKDQVEIEDPDFTEIK